MICHVHTAAVADSFIFHTEKSLAKANSQLSEISFSESRLPRILFSLERAQMEGAKVRDKAKTPRLRAFSQLRTERDRKRFQLVNSVPISSAPSWSSKILLKLRSLLAVHMISPLTCCSSSLSPPSPRLPRLPRHCLHFRGPWSVKKHRNNQKLLF